MIPAVLLAAGASARFAPGHKLLAQYGGKAVIHWSVKAALCARVCPVILVVGHRQNDIMRSLDQLAHHPRLQVVHNAKWSTGRASSLCAGLQAIPSQAPGALVFPADMPLMSTELINAVADGFLQTGALCFPVYDQGKGHPVAFPRSWFDALCQLQGDTSGFELIAANWGSATRLERVDRQTQYNLNTPEDYEKLLQLK